MDHRRWITAGLGCDGDTISITAATQPSIEDVILGAIPGLPKVHLHNPVLAYENGDDFMQYWDKAERGEIDPFVLGADPRHLADHGLVEAAGLARNDATLGLAHRLILPDARERRRSSRFGAGRGRERTRQGIL